MCTFDTERQASYWTMRVGDRISEHAAWSYPQLLPEGPQTQGYLACYWDLMDAWFEEEQRDYSHARNTYKRVDILPSSRHVLDGVTIADTHRPLHLLETELPIRYYLPQQDMRMECLVPTETITYCLTRGWQGIGLPAWVDRSSRISCGATRNCCLNVHPSPISCACRMCESCHLCGRRTDACAQNDLVRVMIPHGLGHSL